MEWLKNVLARCLRVNLTKSVGRRFYRHDIGTLRLGDLLQLPAIQENSHGPQWFSRVQEALAQD